MTTEIIKVDAALRNQGKLDDAIRDHQKAVEIYTRLVEQEGRTELANELAAVHQNLRLAQQRLDGR